jgi:membrane-bound lytic murein transglycosylase D
MVLKRFLLAGSLVAVLVLTGCPAKQNPAAQPPAQATAPSLPAPAPGKTTPAATPVSAAQATQTATPAQAANTERDRALIDAVEKAYHAGMNDYQQGHLASARANFDYAVDLMLKCKCDIRGDQTISDEFDRIVDAVNTLELDALAQGRPLQPQAEAPVDVAGNITTPASPSVTAKATAELKTTQSDLPLVINEYVAAYIDFFSNSP